LQSQIDTLADRVDRLDGRLDELNTSLKIALRLVRGRLAGELQAFRDVEGKL